MNDENKKRNLTYSLIQFIKFNIVGIINTAFTYGVYSLTVFLTNKPFLGVCIDYSVGICTSFILNKHITFKNKEKVTIKMVMNMILSYVPSFVLNLISLDVLINRLHWNKYLAQLLTACCIAYISFIIQKSVVFKTKE